MKGRERRSGEPPKNQLASWPGSSRPSQGDRGAIVRTRRLQAIPRLSKLFQGNSKLFPSFSKEIPNFFFGRLVGFQWLVARNKEMRPSPQFSAAGRVSSARGDALAYRSRKRITRLLPFAKKLSRRAGALGQDTNCAISRSAVGARLSRLAPPRPVRHAPSRRARSGRGCAASPPLGVAARARPQSRNREFVSCHVWTAPLVKGFFAALRTSRVRSCLRPVSRGG